MPTGPCLLCLQALVFYAYGPCSYMPMGPCFRYCFTCCIDCIADDMLSLLSPQYSSSFGSHPNSISLDMTSVPHPGSLSAPPHPAPQLIITFSAPLPELPPVALHPQAVVIEEAEDLDSTYEYWIEEEDTPEVASNARPSLQPESAAASPNPIIGIRIAGVIEAVITSAVPVFQASQPRQSQLPLPACTDSAPRVWRRPPLLIQRPRTSSSIGDGPLFEPLLSVTRCFK